jgi:trehalose 6-phosphate phosphatase
VALVLPTKPDGLAFFLDVDGTLIDIAPTPDSVVVPAELPGDLRELAALAGGALALVSGRDVATMDRLFAPEAFTAAGVHGSEYRMPGGERVRLPVPAALPEIKRELEAFVRDRPGLLLEDKGYALALHYRLAPERADEVGAVMKEVVRLGADELALQPGKMVIEMRPRYASKASALLRLMASPPFAGRIPVAVGDDLTDETMLMAARDMGGLAVRVGTAISKPAERAELADPSAVRNWIARLAGRV